MMFHDELFNTINNFVNLFYIFLIVHSIFNKYKFCAIFVINLNFYLNINKNI